MLRAGALPVGARTNYLVTCSCLPVAASSEVLVWPISTRGSREFTLSSMDCSQANEKKCFCSPGFLQIHVCQLVKKMGKWRCPLSRGLCHPLRMVLGARCNCFAGT